MSPISVEKHISDKVKILGQFFTKETIIEKLLDLLFKYKTYPKNIKILEPSFGTRNFIKVLNKKGFVNIDGCEIDKDLTKNPIDFFDYPITHKYDFIVGNPPFTKYNFKESYYHIEEHLDSPCPPKDYLPNEILLKKEKEKIENIFIFKSLHHLRDKNSTIAFVLPISFFIKNRNKVLKEDLLKYFSTVIIFQNREVWFNYNIPCCFAIFTNTQNFKNKIILYYENKERHREEIEINNFYDELIPEVFHNKKHGLTNNRVGTMLRDYLSIERVAYRRSFNDNNISGKNILDRMKIPVHKNTEDYKLAIVRVGNASVGKCGLINIKNDILNDMFYVFDFDREYNKTRLFKEKICAAINANPDYFRNVTCRVGSKSIKKEDILNFRVTV